MPRRRIVKLLVDCRLETQPGKPDLKPGYCGGFAPWSVGKNRKCSPVLSGEDRALLLEMWLKENQRRRLGSGADGAEVEEPRIKWTDRPAAGPRYFQIELSRGRQVT